MYQQRHSHSLVDPFLAKRFLAVQEKDTPEIRLRFQRFLEDENESDFNALIVFYCPMVFMAAVRLKNRNPKFYVDDLDDMCSDGVFGLMEGIRSFKPGERIIYKRLAVRIRRAIGRATSDRNHGGEDRLARLGVVTAIRRRLMDKLQRLPDEEEMYEELRWQVTNPQLYVGDTDAHRQTPFSQFTKEQDRSSLDLARARFKRPAAAMIDSETINIALKNLKGSDRKLAKMWLDGMCVRDIGKRLNLSKGAAERRMKGIFWELRCQRDLADYLGVEAAPQKPMTKPSLWPAVSVLPPARMTA